VRYVLWSCVCVCLSVSSRCSIKPAKRISTQTTLSLVQGLYTSLTTVWCRTCATTFYTNPRHKSEKSVNVLCCHFCVVLSTTTQHFTQLTTQHSNFWHIFCKLQKFIFSSLPYPQSEQIGTAQNRKILRGRPQYLHGRKARDFGFCAVSWVLCKVLCFHSRHSTLHNWQHNTLTDFSLLCRGFV